MNFDDKYPEVPDDGEIKSVSWTMVRLAPATPCCICGDPTDWVALAFEASVCSEECLAKLDEDFSRACEHPPIEWASDEQIGF